MMHTILERIIEAKLNEAPSIRPGTRGRGKKVLNAAASLLEKPFIAEIKKASPSAGDIRGGADILAQAACYRRGGAGAISVLTESSYFKGSMDDLHAVAASVDLPVLCKDFIVHEAQIEEAYEAGADMVLLIAAILSERRIRGLTAAAGRLGLAVLHEIHGIDEFEKIRGLDPVMVGVNARNLSTLEVNIEGAAHTMGRLRGSFLKVAESGISSAADVRRMRGAGADCFLVGTTLMKSDDPERALRDLYGGLR
jgi:indole-3-glycerol phosphate synthase